LNNHWILNPPLQCAINGNDSIWDRLLCSVWMHGFSTAN